MLVLTVLQAVSPAEASSVRLAVLVHVASCIQELIDLCTASPLPNSNGWAIHVWSFSQGQLDSLANCYRTLLQPQVNPTILSTLASQSIDLNALLLDEDSEVDRITRADMIELAGAAVLSKLDGWPLDTMIMPNVPKGSRSKSESGIDILSVKLDAASSDLLADSDRLYIGSVKHSVGDSSSDITTKLLSSISPRELSHIYLAGQLRLLHGHLLEMSFQDPDRVFLFLAESHSFQVEIAIVGAVDTVLEEDFAKQMHRLPKVAGYVRHCVRLLVPSIKTLHTLV